MLNLKGITKIYKIDKIEQKVLNKVSINFRKNEFVSILGPSGSGKSTLLNIIGGLDHYTHGDLIINGISTKKYTDEDWDTYRNHKIGFIFQNYNLIAHQSVLANVELALTLSGVSKVERIKKAKEALQKVGLSHHINKKPSQLSGGQMQRVAIARALVNNPDIILADEPTGALDSETSIQIMDLLKEVAREKLVIMVTHNPEIAEKYSTRIVNLKDGKIISDSKPFTGKEKTIKEDNKDKSSMNILTALALSKNNLLTKRGRTIMTAIAGSVGIIGIALVLFLSNGVNNYINDMKSSASTSEPISIQDTITEEVQVDSTSFEKKSNSYKNKILATDDISNSFSLSEKASTRKIELKNLKNYINKNKDKIDKYASDIQYTYNINIDLYDKNKETGELVKVNPVSDEEVSSGFLSYFSTSIMKNSFKELKNSKQYTIVSGTMPKNKNEVVLVVNKKMQINLSTMYTLNFEDQSKIADYINKSNQGEKIKLDDITYDYNNIIGKTYKLINAVDYYKKDGNIWVSYEHYNDYLNDLYNKAEDIKIVGIVKIKNKNMESGFLGYNHDLMESYIKYSSNSDIAKEQLTNKDIDVFTNNKFDGINSTYSNNCKRLGIADIDNPNSINIYPKEVNDKENIKKFLDNYNKSVSKENKIKYVDLVESLGEGLSSIVGIISGVMIAFVSISLIVSSIMIGIITYISVLERTKEIGILRAIGASKKDVKRVFRAETIIEGLISGVLGIIISVILSLMVNVVVKALADIDQVMSFSIIHALVLIGISVLLTVIAGLAPANMASKKDPVESLRSE